MNPIDLRPRVVSPPGAFVRVTERPDGTRLYVAPRPDGMARLARAFGQFTRALGLSLAPSMRAAAEAALGFDKALAKARAMSRVPQYLRDEANALPPVAGLEARYYVRAALDPAFTTTEALSWLVGRLLAGDRAYDTDLWLVTPENRRRVAVAAMRGWEERGRPVTAVPEPALIAHRAWPLTRLEVRCG